MPRVALAHSPQSHQVVLWHNVAARVKGDAFLIDTGEELLLKRLEGGQSAAGKDDSTGLGKDFFELGRGVEENKAEPCCRLRGLTKDSVPMNIYVQVKRSASVLIIAAAW